MPSFRAIFDWFGKKDNMANSDDSPPSDILGHRYQDPQVLISYLKKSPRNFTDAQIKVKLMKDGRLGVWLPRKLEKEEIDGALQDFLAAERKRQNDDEE